MNLSTARASQRAKEIGIKKTVGANRNGLIVQYLGESVIITFLSLVVAVLLVMLFLPQFNIITGKHLTFSLTPQDIVAILGITFLTGLISGSYPALYLSALSAATVLKGKLTTSVSELVARKGLVIFQFTLSIIFIASILVIYRQIQFIQSGDRGYDRDNIILFELTGALRDTQKQETLISEMRNVPGVENASSISNTMTGHNAAIYGLQWEGYNPNDKTEFEHFTVNYGMIETLGMKMAAGRSFSKEYSMDTAKIIFNESAIRFMGLEDPIGKVVKLWGKERQIIGIVKDFNFESVHDVIKPAFFRLEPNDTYLMMVKLSNEHQKETLDLLTDLYQKINPGFIFDYSYLDTNYQALYAGEQKLATLSNYFAGLVVLISCLGLFGLAAFTAERRVKEIGIRKVLGASVMGIIYLLSVDFTGIVFAAILIAVPVSYFIATSWLNTFAFRISLQWWYFVVPALTALFIAWLTVGLQV
jgi:ABC-type antimicrobial peptide transport system permease subunit